MAVVIPCHNEAATLAAVLEVIPQEIGQIIVVDNGSTDGTAAIAKAHPRCDWLYSPRKLGVGGALIAGSRQVRDGIDYICKLDGDNQFAPVALERFLGLAGTADADLLRSSRTRLESWHLEPSRRRRRHFGNQLVTLLTALASGYYFLSDATCGLFVVRRQALDLLTRQAHLATDYRFEVSLLVELGRLGASIVEYRIPVSYPEERRKTFSSRALLLPMTNTIVRGWGRRLLQNHLYHSLSLGGVLLLLAGGNGLSGGLLLIYAGLKALQQQAPTTPGVANLFTLLLGSAGICLLGFLLFDLLATHSRFRSRLDFSLWKQDSPA